MATITVGNTTGQANDYTVDTNTGAASNSTQRIILATDDPAVTSLAIIDDWDESDRAKVNLIVGQAGIAGGTGTDGATVPRVTLATNVALPAGTNAIGKLSANNGVDIGDVDVTSVIAGTGATNLGKAEDAGHTTGDTGVFILGVRRDTPASGADTTVDYASINLDAAGLLYVREVPRRRTTWYDLVCQNASTAALDQLADEVELTGMALVANGGGDINNLVLVANNLTIISAALWLYQINPTAAGTNAVHNQTDGNNESSRIMGAVYFTNWVTETDNMHAIGTYAGQPLGACPLSYQCLDGTNTMSLWGILATYTTVTPGATTDYNLMVTHTPGV